MESEIKIICLETEAFHSLIKEVVNKLVRESGDKIDKWISKQEAKQMLRVSSDTTLQKLRDEGKIRFSQPEKKIILYDSESILLFLEQNVKEPF